jgi:hypothetical protein
MAIQNQVWPGPLFAFEYGIIVKVFIQISMGYLEIWLFAG